MKIRLCILFLLLFISCVNESPNKLWNNANTMRSQNNLKESIIYLESIIKNHPNHNLAEKSQFQIAEIYLNDIKDFDIAIEEFNKVIFSYPDSDVAKNSLFMIAYIYNNYLGAYSDAINSYNQFLSKYPNDELIPSVMYELEGMIKIQDDIDSLNSILSKELNL